MSKSLSRNSYDADPLGSAGYGGPAAVNDERKQVASLFPFGSDRYEMVATTTLNFLPTVYQPNGDDSTSLHGFVVDGSGSMWSSY